ncbi:hypothetical protein Clark_0053, partial [Mycobacterium phage Clark]
RPSVHPLRAPRTRRPRRRPGALRRQDGRPRIHPAGRDRRPAAPDPPDHHHDASPARLRSSARRRRRAGRRRRPRGPLRRRARYRIPAWRRRSTGGRIMHIGDLFMLPVIAIVLTTAAPAGAAAASEAGYLARLGVDYGYQLNAESIPAALEAGRVLCDEMRAGTPRDKLTASVFQAIPGVTQDQAGGMVFAAHTELCPDTGEFDAPV